MSTLAELDPTEPPGSSRPGRRVVVDASDQLLEVEREKETERARASSADERFWAMAPPANPKTRGEVSRQPVPGPQPKRGESRRSDVDAILSRLPETLVDVIERALGRIAATQDAVEHLDTDIWGDAPDLGRYAEVTLEAHIEADRAHAFLLENSLPLEDAARELGATVEQLSQLVRDGRVVTVGDATDLRLPAWQLRRGELLPGLAALANTFPGSVEWFSAWMTTAHPRLDGATPTEALARGGTDRVIALVRGMHG